MTTSANLAAALNQPVDTVIASGNPGAVHLRQIVGCRQSISSDAVETETADRRLRLPLTLLAARERQRERRWEARQVTTANREAGKAM
jgi:hypothetical protein